MRTVRIDDSDSDHTWLWLAAGAVLGLAAGVLVAERMSGRKVTVAGLIGRGRKLATQAARNLGPLLETAESLRGAWRSDEDDDLDDDRDDDRDDDEEGEDVGDEDSDDLAEAAEDEREERDAAAIDERVLEAFANDPVLARRAVEIEASDEGDVVLHGRVRTAREVKHAVTIAKGVPGVTRVRQRLTIR